MTVIVWDGKTLAADKRMTWSYTISPQVTKISREVKGEVLVGLTGVSSVALEVLNWWRNGADVEKYPASNRSRIKVQS